MEEALKRPTDTRCTGDALSVGKVLTMILAQTWTHSLAGYCSSEGKAEWGQAEGTAAKRSSLVFREKEGQFSKGYFYPAST